jgi:hypothetical protein
MVSERFMTLVSLPRAIRPLRTAPVPSLLMGLVAALYLGPGGLQGQEQEVPVGPVGFGTLNGVVYDSTRSEPLNMARVFVAGTAINAITDSEGRFTLENVPAGPQVVSFDHARLEDLRIGPPSAAVMVPAAGVAQIYLAVPTIDRIHAAFCPESRGVSAVVTGSVREYVYRSLVQGALVQLVWETDTGLDRREVRSDQSGEFIFCDLPDADRYRVQAGVGTWVSQSAWVELNADGFGREVLTLYERGEGTLVGRVVDVESRQPLEGAEVILRGTPFRTVSNQSGRFLMKQIPYGQYAVEVEYLGFRPQVDSVEVADRPVDLAVWMAPRPIEVEGISVIVRPLGLENAGFFVRQDQAQGVFFDQHDIMLRDPLNVSELFQEIPSLRLRPSRYSMGYELVGRAGCRPTYYVNGQHHPRDIFKLDDFHPRAVHGIEVYRSPGEIPSEFNRTNMEQGGFENPCAVVVVWTG